MTPIGGDIRWRKSSRSTSGGGQCVEVGAWRKSSRSSSGGGQCVEVGATADLIAVRDSKHPSSGILASAPAEWTSLLTALKHDTLHP